MQVFKSFAFCEMSSHFCPQHQKINLNTFKLKLISRQANPADVGKLVF